MFNNFWQYTIENMHYYLSGLAYTGKLWFIVILVTLPLATIIAIFKVSGPKWLKTLLNLYTWIFRGSPLLLQLFLAYFGLPYVGLILPTNLVVISVFVLCFTAYTSEFVRGGIISIEIGQYEACKVLGMNKVQTMYRVIIPQTVRKVLPQTCSQSIVLFKDTSLVAAIGVGDLLRSARSLVLADLRMDAFVVVLFFYLLISSIMVISFNKLEKKYSTYV